MYTVIRKYNLHPGKKEAFIQEVQVRLVPLLNHIPGIRAFKLLEVGDNEVVVISYFNTRA